MKKWLLKRLSIFRTLPKAILIGTFTVAAWSLIEWAWPGGRGFDKIDVWFAAIAGAWIAL